MESILGAVLSGLAAIIAAGVAVQQRRTVGNGPESLSERMDRLLLEVYGLKEESRKRASVVDDRFDRYEERLATLDAYAHAQVHDLRNSHTALMGMASLFREELEEQRKWRRDEQERARQARDGDLERRAEG